MTGDSPWHALLAAHQPGSEPWHYFDAESRHDPRRVLWCCPHCDYPPRSLVVVLDASDTPPRCRACKWSPGSLDELRTELEASALRPADERPYLQPARNVIEAARAASPGRAVPLRRTVERVATFEPSAAVEVAPDATAGAHEAVPEATPKAHEAVDASQGEAATSRGFSQVPHAIVRGEYGTARGPLTARACQLYAVILGFTTMRGGVCRASQATLAERVGVSDRQVRTLLSELSKARVIDRRHRGRGRTDVITPLVVAQDRKSASAQDRKSASVKRHYEGSNNQRRTDGNVGENSYGSEERA